MQLIKRPFAIAASGVIILMLLLVITFYSTWDDIIQQDSPVTVHQTVIHALENARAEPHSLAEFADGGIIIAGGNIKNQSAWASKVSRSGDLLWSYYAFPSNRSYPPFSFFQSAAIMPDGSLYLCGQLNKEAPEDPKPAILSHLSAEGQVLREQLFSPPGLSRYRASFDRCVTWGDGLVLLGQVAGFVDASGLARHDLKSYFWVLLLDKSGRLSWQTLIPAEGGDQLDLPALRDDDLTFSAPRSRGETDVIRISRRGKVLNRTILPWDAIAVEGSYNKNDPVRLISIKTVRYQPPISNKISIVTLDDNLRVIDTLPIQTDRRVGPQYILGCDNGGLLAASVEVTGGGTMIGSQIMYLNGHSPIPLLTDVDTAPYRDQHYFAAAIRSNKPGTFVALKQISISTSKPPVPVIYTIDTHDLCP